jgi:hypothetical protein
MVRIVVFLHVMMRSLHCSYDSAEDVNIAVFTPHTGFKDPSAPPGAPLRESIELRALVFYE